MDKSEEMRMTHSGIIAKQGRRHVLVRFERGTDIAEASLPECKVTKNQGFSEEEVAGLELYLEMQNDEIFAKAKAITNIMHWF